MCASVLVGTVARAPVPVPLFFLVGWGVERAWRVAPLVSVANKVVFEQVQSEWNDKRSG